MKGLINRIYFRLLKNPVLLRLIRRRSPAFSAHKGQIARTGIVEINLAKLKKSKDRIFVFGLPKSGTVWLAKLIADCLGLPFPGRVTHCHQSFSEIHHRFNPQIIRGVYLMRDIRDVIVSHFHFRKTKGWREETQIYDDIESFYYEFFINLRVYGSSWKNWVEHPNDFILFGLPLVKYERLWDNPLRELERLFERWKVSVSKQVIKRSIESNSLDAYKNGQNVPQGEFFDSGHYRKGGYGNYKSELPQNIIDDINNRFGDYLKKWGYKV